jgi:hypothetical protein
LRYVAFTATIPDKVYTVIVGGGDLEPSRLGVTGGVGNNEPQVALMQRCGAAFCADTAANIARC